MNIFIYAIFVIIIAVLMIWLIDYLGLRDPFDKIMRVLIGLAAVVLIAQRAGVV